MLHEIAVATLGRMVSCPVLHLPACGRSEPSVILNILRVQALAPGATLRPIRGWASSTSTIHRRIVHVMDFADTLTDTSFESFAVDMIIGTNGAEALGAAPTPQKRGPPPIPSWRGGRLPTCLAARSRPKVSLPLLPLDSNYKNINTAHWRVEASWIVETVWVAPSAR
jgi:hypothetical protein